MRTNTNTQQPRMAQDKQVLKTMRDIFIFLTLTISVRFIVEAVFEFKVQKDEVFYTLLIVRKLVNISLITILSVSIRRVLK